MIYLTPEQVLFIHARLIDETGGRHGILDLGLLESAVERPKATFEGKELYPGLFTKAAAILDSIVNNHPFLDGNKPTGIASAVIFIRENGGNLTAGNDELESFTLQVVTDHPGLVSIAAWLEMHTTFE